MTLTINLSPEAELRLRERAEQDGRSAETLAAAIIADALEWQALDVAEAVAGIQRGMDDGEAGRVRSFDDFAEEQRRKPGLPALDDEQKECRT
jgi:predicted transcriptional regulator